MEKDGWLDQILLGIIDFLMLPWLSVVVALVGGFTVAYLARLSPRQDWEFISEWPGRVLTGAFVLFATVRSVPRLVLPSYRFVCDSAPGVAGLPVTTDCDVVTAGSVRFVSDYTFVDMIRDFALSLVQDFVLGGVGAGLGLLAALVVQRSRRVTP